MVELSTSSTPRAREPARTEAHSTIPTLPLTSARWSSESERDLPRILPAPEALTQTVISGNTAAIANRAALPRLKHCFLVIRENRTYDEVLGDVSGSNGAGPLWDARLGHSERLQAAQATHALWEREGRNDLRVTPNLHAIANRFAMSDNFYVDSDVSADGHRWVVGIHPTPYFNTAWTSGYGDRRHERRRSGFLQVAVSKAPPKSAIAQSLCVGAPDPAQRLYTSANYCVANMNGLMQQEALRSKKAVHTNGELPDEPSVGKSAGSRDDK